MDDHRAVCIVGAGPRGVSVFERLLANLADLDRPDLDVHIVDPHEPGGGQIWRRDQPGDLLMNTVAGHATQFTDDSVRGVPRIVPGPTVHQWAQQVIDRSDTDLPDDVVAEARAMRPWSHPTRRFHGYYLRWVFDSTRGRLPDGMRVFLHRARAVAVDETPDGRQKVVLTDAEDLAVDAVVLATGHGTLEPSTEQRALAAFAADHAGRGSTYVAPGNPIEQDLSGIRGGRPVLVRGLGMNFFDVMSMLTIGRGGRFEPAGGDGALRYLPSGEEPILHAGSRRGVPYHARGSYGRMPPGHPPRYFDDAAVARLRGRRGQVDFRAEVWPLIAKDAAYVYYDRLLAERPEAVAMDPERFRAEFEKLAWDDPRMAELLAEAVADPADRIDFAALDRPLAGRSFADPDGLTRWMLDHLRADARQAHRASASPLKHAMTALGASRVRVRELAEQGGLRGGSQLADLDGWFRGFAASLASGPPVRRVEELVALIEAGVMRFVGPGMRVGSDPEQGVFTGSSPQVAGPPVTAPALIEAYLPDPDLRRTADPLWRRLRDSGRARPYRMVDATVAEGFVETGGVEVSDHPYHLVDADGRPDRRRFVVGIPTEPVHWGPHWERWPAGTPTCSGRPTRWPVRCWTCSGTQPGHDVFRSKDRR